MRSIFWTVCYIHAFPLANVSYLRPEMLPALDNFVSFGTDVFKQRADYRQMITDIYVTSISNDHLGENDRVVGCKLAETMMLNLRGHADEVGDMNLVCSASSHPLQCLQIFVATGFDQLDKAETNVYKLANLEVLINAILYNAAATLHILETLKQGAARTFFSKWIAAINVDKNLPRVHDKKLTICALCSLLEMDQKMIPDSLQNDWSGIVGAAMTVFHQLPRALAGWHLVQSFIVDHHSYFVSP